MTVFITTDRPVPDIRLASTAKKAQPPIQSNCSATDETRPKGMLGEDEAK